MTLTLNELRVEIDGIDRELLKLLNKRAHLAELVGAIKQKEGGPFLRPDRVFKVIESLQQINTGPFKNEHISAVWREIMSACLSLESATKVAYLGPAGTFSEQAALKFFGSSIEHIPCVSIDEVFRTTTAGGASFGVVPVENSNEGVVSRSLDLLLTSPLHIVGETSLAIEHHLLRTTAAMADIEAIYAHPQALAQCQDWLNLHLPSAARMAASSNAEGARLACTNQSWAAIASERAASRFGLDIVARGIQDDAFNRTRFAVICLPTTLPPLPASGSDCTSLVLSVPNRAGAVHDILVPLKNHGVSMSRFESRPARSGQWEYNFFIDLQGHTSDDRVKAALDELQQMCAFYKVLGSYPVSN